PSSIKVVIDSPSPNPSTNMPAITNRDGVAASINVKLAADSVIRTVPVMIGGRYPWRSSQRPAITEEVLQPSTWGAIANPARVGDLPRTPWTKRGTKEIEPNMPIPVRNAVELLEAITRLRKRFRGRKGSSTRRSQRKKTAKVATPPTNSTQAKG